MMIPPPTRSSLSLSPSTRLDAMKEEEERRYVYTSVNKYILKLSVCVFRCVSCVGFEKTKLLLLLLADHTVVVVVVVVDGGDGAGDYTITRITLGWVDGWMLMLMLDKDHSWSSPS